MVCISSHKDREKRAWTHRKCSSTLAPNTQCSFSLPAFWWNRGCHAVTVCGRRTNKCFSPRRCDLNGKATWQLCSERPHNQTPHPQLHTTTSVGEAFHSPLHACKIYNTISCRPLIWESFVCDRMSLCPFPDYYSKFPFLTPTRLFILGIWVFIFTKFERKNLWHTCHSKFHIIWRTSAGLVWVCWQLWGSVRNNFIEEDHRSPLGCFWLILWYRCDVHGSCRRWSVIF